MKTYIVQIATAIFAIFSLAFPTTCLAEDQNKPDSLISTLEVLLRAQNKSDLVSALSVTRGEAAKSVAPSFANTSLTGLKYDLERLKSKKTKEIDGYSIMTVSVTAIRGGKSKTRDMKVVGIKLDGKWVITQIDDDGRKLAKKDYENMEAVSIGDAKKEYEKSRESFKKLYNR